MHDAIIATDLLARLATCQLQELERSSAQYVTRSFGLRTLIEHAAHCAQKFNLIIPELFIFHKYTHYSQGNSE